MGRQVAHLLDGIKPAGYHDITWDGSNQFGDDVSSGMYIYSIQAGDFIKNRKMVLMK